MVKLQHSQGSPRGQRQACNYKFSSFSYPTRSLIAHVFAFSNRLGPNARHMPFNTNIITEWILHRQLNDSITAKWSFPCTEQRTKKTASLLFSFTIFLPALPLFFLVSRMFGEMTEDEEEEEVKSAFQEQFTCRWARRGNCESGATIWSNNKVVHCQQILLRCEIIFSPLNERREIDEGEFSFLHTCKRDSFVQLSHWYSVSVRGLWHHWAASPRNTNPPLTSTASISFPSAIRYASDSFAKILFCVLLLFMYQTAFFLLSGDITVRVVHEKIIMQRRLKAWRWKSKEINKKRFPL